MILDHVFSPHGATSFGDGYHLRIYPCDAFRPHDATPTKVEEGETVTSLDIDVPVSKLYSLSGAVERPDAASQVNAAHLTLSVADTGEELASTDVSLDDGGFRFDFVPGGNYVLKATKIGEAERREVPACNGCIPPTHTETKMLERFGDVSQPIELTTGKSNVQLQAAAPKKQ